MLGNIYLVGPMGAGKTTIGRLLSQQLGLEFLDVDSFIVERTGVDIPVIFEYEGESGFREREHKALELIAQCSGLVVATGGGAVTTPENLDLIKKSGVTVYLSVSVQEQLKRMKNDKNRPLLQTGNPEKTLRDMTQLRTPLYESVADFSFSTDNNQAHNVTQSIVNVLEAHFENPNR